MLLTSTEDYLQKTIAIIVKAWSNYIEFFYEISETKINIDKKSKYNSQEYIRKNCKSYYKIKSNHTLLGL